VALGAGMVVGGIAAVRRLREAGRRDVLPVPVG
jgi:hypothetical protein